MVKIFILSKEGSNNASLLKKIFSDHNFDVSLIIDLSSNYKIRDFILKKFGYVNSTEELYIKRPSAWDIALLKAKQSIHKYDSFFFIEEDVYSKTPEVFIDVINICKSLKADLVATDIQSQESSPNWTQWSKAWDIDVKQRFHSFNPFCMISKRLLKDIFKFKKLKGKFIFHEVMFSSIARENNFTMIDFKKEEKLREYFGTFDWRPYISDEEINSGKILHPIKEKW